MTLLEVLIAVTLVSLLSVAMLYSVQAGLGSVASINRRVDNIRKASGAQRILEQQFAAFMPVVAPCGCAVPDARPQSALFFEGQPTVMRFVSAYSLAESGRGQPKILELFTVPTRGRSAGRPASPALFGAAAVVGQFHPRRPSVLGCLRLPGADSGRALHALGADVDQPRCAAHRRAHRDDAATRRRPVTAAAAAFLRPHTAQPERQ
jgi:type II secretory pathway pseudopilin PulG